MPEVRKCVTSGPSSGFGVITMGAEGVSSKVVMSATTGVSPTGVTVIVEVAMALWVATVLPSSDRTRIGGRDRFFERGIGGIPATDERKIQSPGVMGDRNLLVGRDDGNGLPNSGVVWDFRQQSHVPCSPDEGRILERLWHKKGGGSIAPRDGSIQVSRHAEGIGETEDICQWPGIGIRVEQALDRGLGLLVSEEGHPEQMAGVP